MKRILNKIREIVKAHVEDARTDDNTEGNAHNEKQNIIKAKPQFPPTGDAIEDDSGKKEPEDIGDTIPAHLKRPDGKSHRV